MPEEQVFTEKEKIALQQFKERLANLDLENEDLLEDRRLINWLRARDLRLDDAETMFRRHLVWRQEHKIDTILKSHNIPEEGLKTVPAEINGVDKDGNPLLILFPGRFEIKKNVQHYGKPTSFNVFYYFLEAMYEECVRTSKDINALKKCTYIFDLEGMRYQDCLSTDVLDILLTISKDVEANYPEFLQKGFIINAPSLFPMLWNLVKPFLSPKTIKNVHIFNTNLDNFRNDLLEQIPQDQLARKWGGTGYSKRLPLLNRYSTTAPITAECCKDFEETNISAGDSLELPFEVETPLTLLSWRFKTKGYDIGFSVVQRQLLSDDGDDELEEIEIIEYKRYNAQKYVQIGSLVCETRGNYILRFDNTYSKLRGKTLVYLVEVSHAANTENHNENDLRSAL